MKKTALTIGFFDGVHLGHQALLHILRQKPHATILTFSNHPKSILSPPAPELLLPFEERIAILKKYADELLIWPFNHELANTPFDQLLEQFSLSHLVLGEGSVFGKKRGGNEANVRKYAAEKGIIVEYVTKMVFENQVISSSRIRQAIENQQLTLAKQLLGTK